MVAHLEASPAYPAATHVFGPIGMPAILSGIAGAVVLADVCWAAVGRFDIDLAGYAKLGVLAVLLGLGSLFYARVRKSRELSAMLFGAAFLVAFSAGLSVLNYFLLDIAGHRIDRFLAVIDRALGVDWPAMMAFVAVHPAFNLLLRAAYTTTLPEVALLIVVLGCRGFPDTIYEFCLALAIAAAVTVAFWTVFPSIGAVSIYELPREVARRLHPELGAGYVREMLGLLHNGPGWISPDQTEGLIAFPSFHAGMAALVAWNGRKLRYLRWPLVVWNVLVLVATPVHGGHFVVDVIAGLAVAAGAVLLTTKIAIACGASARAPSFGRQASPVGAAMLPESAGSAV